MLSFSEGSRQNLEGSETNWSSVTKKGCRVRQLYFRVTRHSGTIGKDIQESRRNERHRAGLDTLNAWTVPISSSGQAVPTRVCGQSPRVQSARGVSVSS